MFWMREGLLPGWLLDSVESTAEAPKKSQQEKGKTGGRRVMFDRPWCKVKIQARSGPRSLGHARFPVRVTVTKGDDESKMEPGDGMATWQTAIRKPQAWAGHASHGPRVP